GLAGRTAAVRAGHSGRQPGRRLHRHPARPAGAPVAERHVPGERPRSGPGAHRRGGGGRLLRVPGPRELMELRCGAVRVGPLRRRDRDAWQRLRRRNVGWLLRWEATSPDGTVPQASFTGYVRQLNRAARQDTGYAFVVEYRGELVGQVSVAGVSRGSLQSASIGYWISEHVAGRGIIPTAVAIVADHCFTDQGLHRVVDKLGFRDEGVRRSYLHIQGEWADHRSFALTADEAAPSLLERWLASRGSAPPTPR